MRHVLVRQLAYAPEQLFALVGDVDRYPEFVPWITHLRSWNRRETSSGVSSLDAEAQVKFHVVRERFSTRVRLDHRALAIDVSLLAGPFRRLTNRWRFRSKRLKNGAHGCELVFEIDFEFGSRLLQGMLAANFERAVTRLVRCFEDRAAELYEPAPPADLA